MKLSKIEIITGMSKLTGLKSVLSRAGVRGMTVVQVLGCGVEKGTKEYEVDENYENGTVAEAADQHCCKDRKGQGNCRID